MQDERWLLPEGIDEVLPPEADHLEGLRRELIDLYRSWGYELVFPPFIEFTDSLLANDGGDLDLRTFKLTDQLSGRTLGIRADITPQTARIDAHPLKRERPSRLCYVGMVLQTRSSGFAASRAPIQVGAELFGHNGVESDLEVLRLMLETLALAGIQDIYLDLGHVGIFRGLAREAGLSPDQEQALFDALQRKAVPELEELVSRYRLPVAEARMLVGLAELSGDDDVLSRGRRLLHDAGPEVRAALDALEAKARYFAARRPGLPLHFDLAELRSYHYHTGVVFAAYLPGLGQEIARGGRYDGAGAAFGRARPACGFSADLKTLLQFGARKAQEAALVFAPWDEDAALREQIRQLRAAGRRVVCALPDQTAGAQEMGCGEILRKQGGEWVLQPL